MSAMIPRSSLFDDFFKDMAPGFFVRPLHGDPLPSPSQLRVDVKETEGAYEVTAEIPGVDKKDIHVHVDGNLVSLNAEIRQADERKDGEKVLRSERYYGAVSRSFQLPVAMDESRTTAKYEDGVLTLTLPKQAAPSSRRIAVE